MKEMLDVYILKVALQGLLQRVQGAAGRGTDMPLLRCVLLEVDGWKLRASATDLEIGITSSADIEESIYRGRVAVPLNTLLEIVKRMPSQLIHLQEIAGQQLQITAEDAEVKLKCEDAIDYPTVALRTVGDHALDITADVYQQLIKATKHAVCTDLVKYNLNCVNFKLQGQRLTACATDGHRLSLAGKDLDPESVASNSSFDHMLSRKALAEIEKLNDGHTQIYIYDNQIAFVQATLTLIIRLLDGDFPDYRKIIPTDHPGIISITAADFLASIDRVRQVYSSKTSTLQLNASGNQLTLTAESETGHARDIVPVEMEGDNIQVGVSANYLTDAVTGLGEDIVIKYKTSFDALVILPQDYGTFDERLDIVMPKRL
ncbi:DNA polymerase III subunit beta [Geopsychrobacter electrodiphilus]|uniref:DNA polymerase III subunit beta n=1 Tax=Geopsychrobacter electrodiphilus TaxID=225196 RepID=UPI00035DE74E|nr:DNA polymerase III subunit beta [Geopsychrobacter electrodiphilus]